MHQIRYWIFQPENSGIKVPIDNLCNYDSTKEYIIQVLDAESMIHSSLLFAAKSMLKVMDGELLNAAKRTKSKATKLSEDEADQ